MALLGWQAKCGFVRLVGDRILAGKMLEKVMESLLSVLAAKWGRGKYVLSWKGRRKMAQKPNLHAKRHPLNLLV